MINEATSKFKINYWCVDCLLHAQSIKFLSMFAELFLSWFSLSWCRLAWFDFSFLWRFNLFRLIAGLIFFWCHLRFVQIQLALWTWCLLFFSLSVIVLSVVSCKVVSLFRILNYLNREKCSIRWRSWWSLMGFLASLPSLVMRNTTCTK